MTAKTTFRDDRATSRLKLTLLRSTSILSSSSSFCLVDLSRGAALIFWRSMDALAVPSNFDFNSFESGAQTNDEGIVVWELCVVLEFTQPFASLGNAEIDIARSQLSDLSVDRSSFRSIT